MDKHKNLNDRLTKEKKKLFFFNRLTLDLRLTLTCIPGHVQDMMSRG